MTFNRSKINDVIIIGAGGAGSSAAIELKLSGYNPLVVTKGSRYDSKTYRAQGGIQAVFDKTDSLMEHYQDTINCGNSKSNPELVRILTSKAVGTIKWLESLSIKFDKIDNEYYLKTAGGISKPRILSCGGEAGKRIAQPLWNYCEQIGIEFNEHTAVTSLRKEKNLFLVDLKVNDENLTVKARAIIIASGGYMPKEKSIGIESDYTPSGIELAQQLGAKVVNPDLMQYHPTGVVIPSELRRVRLPETMRSLGARLKNKDFAEFTDSLGTRKHVTSAIIKEVEKGKGVETETGKKGVYLDLSMISDQHGLDCIKHNFPKLYSDFSEQGIDLNSTMVIVYPVLHYSLGGIQINEYAESTIPGLYAAGETTWGVHGEDRLMGNSLLDVFVFGRIAGNSVSNYLENS